MASSTLIGREKEIKMIEDAIKDKLSTKTKGILHVVGVPGTGKTMSVDHVLNEISFDPKYKLVKRVYINCMSSPTCKSIFARICLEMNVKLPRGASENEMNAQLLKAFEKNFSILVLDELDKLPKQQNLDFVRSCTKWSLMLIGISNTNDLTSRYDSMAQVAGRRNIVRVVFEPYNSETILRIFKWYMENDENYVVHNDIINTKGIDMIAKKTAKENGDIRQALNSFKSLIDDSSSTQVNNLSCVVNSIKKRQRKDSNDLTLATQILLMICAKAKDQTITYDACIQKLSSICQKESYGLTKSEFKGLVSNMECLGLLGVKKLRSSGKEKLYLKADVTELDMYLTKKDTLMQYF